ncbi:MAG: hypothetical protein ABI806_19370 [Candidatus Solibacter sp.]
MKLLAALALVLALTLSASAADVTGTWSGSLKVTGPDGQVQDDTIHLILKQDGAKLTGTAGPSAEQQLPIDKGAVDGGKVTLEVSVGQGVFKFELALDAEHLKGDVTLSAGPQTMKAKMDATRAAK